jgi:hypothetical protein
VIGVDDLQWADPSGLLTLGALSRRVTDLPVALIGCMRPSPRAAELVAEAVAAVPGLGLLARVPGAAGNPLFAAGFVSVLAG